MSGASGRTDRELGQHRRWLGGRRSQRRTRAGGNSLGMGQGMQTFVIAFFGGMIARLIAVAVLSVVVLRWAEIHAESYFVALVAAYLLFLAFEIFYVLKLQGRAKR